MTEIKTTKIPRRQKCVDKDHPYIGGSVDVIDDALGKPQSQVNQERIAEESTLDGKIALEKQRAEGIESGLSNRLGTVEQLAEISIGGGDAQIATGADFTNPDATKRAKVPTVGAIVDGLNDGVYDVSKRNPTAGPNSDGKFTLEYILNNADTLIPTSWRHGGMLISFVDSSDNNYVKFFCNSQNFTTDVTQWQGVDEEPNPNSKNLVESGGVNNYILDTQENIDKISQLDLVTLPDFVLKHISTTGSLENNSNKNAVFNSKVKALIGSYFYVDEGYKYQYALYDYTTGTFISRVSWKQGSIKTILDNNYQIRIEISDLQESILEDTSISEHLHCILLSSSKTIKEMVLEHEDTINDLNTDIDNDEIRIRGLERVTDINILATLPDFVLKHIGTNGGLENNSNKNASFSSNVKALKGSYFYVDTGYKYQYALYDYSTGSFIRRIPWIQGQTKSVLDNNYQIKIEISDSEESVLQDTSISEHLHCYLIAEERELKDWVDETDESVKELQDNITNVYPAYYHLSEQADNLISIIGLSSFIRKTMTVIVPDKYSCWPRIGCIGNKLVLLYVKALVHEDPHNGKGQIYATVSANGIVWTPTKLVIDTPNKRDGITGCGNDENGNLLFINRVGYPSNSETFVEVYRTSDGIDFEKISTIPAEQRLGHCGDIINVPTRGLMAFFGNYGSSADWGYILSTDNGSTWSRTVIENVIKEERPMEMSAAYLGDGKILVVGRYEGDGTAKMWQMQSEDYGITWSKIATNISGNSNTPSIIYNSTTEKVSLYIYKRSTGNLEYREADVANIWDNPTNWPTPTTIATGTTGQDAGNVSTCAFKNSQIATYYSGAAPDTGIYCVLNKEQDE